VSLTCIYNELIWLKTYSCLQKENLYIPFGEIFFSILPVQASEDCTAIGQVFAAEQGGRLTEATSCYAQCGKGMCVIVVLLPGRNGEKPCRVEIAI